MRAKYFVLVSALTFLSLTFYGQSGFPYDSAWKKIDVLIQKRGLPQSALAEVNKLYAAAKKDRREDQWIKATIYRIQLTENSQDETAFRLTAWDSAVTGTPATVRAVLLSAEATALKDYSQQYRYRRSTATTVTGDSSTDVATWPAAKTSALVKTLYLHSLADSNKLKKTSLRGYETILLPGNSRNLRPTLYDLLIFRALDYFTSLGSEQETSSGELLKSDTVLFSPAHSFRQIDLSRADTTLSFITALQLFQQVMSFHEGDNDPSAGIDADLDRLAFVFNVSTSANKDSLYLSALDAIVAKFPRVPAAAEAGFLMANWHYRQGSDYDPITNTSHRFELVKAKQIAERFAALPDSSEGRSNCQELLMNIGRSEMKIETEKVNVPGLPFRVLLTYKNLAKIHGRLIRIDDPTRAALTANGYQDATWKKLAHFPADMAFTFAIPATDDYQQHRVELPVGSLLTGQYALLTSSDTAFSVNSLLAVNYFFNSSIAYLWHGKNGFVADRTSGKPLAGVRVAAFDTKYNNGGKPVLVQTGLFFSDAHGFFKTLFPATSNPGNHTYIFSLGQDALTAAESYQYSYSNQIDTDTVGDVEGFTRHWLRGSLFTDRGIYRPGQKVFVKALIMTKDITTRAYKVAAAAHSKFYLLDANQQRIDSISYLTNAFGSFADSFLLPVSTLTGMFTIQDSVTGSTTNFSVEDYKRPTFFVALDTPSGTVRLGDSVHFTGTATSYAGSSISRANVVYRVYREARFPYPWYFRATPGGQEQQMSQGTITTDDDGHFTVAFKAVADPSVLPTIKPVFTYRISVAVSDQNGETREGSGSVSVSRQTFQIVSPLAKESVMSADSFAVFPVTTTDANGRFMSRNISVSLYALAMPDHLIRDRYWIAPDQHVLDKAAFSKLFPRDQFDNETDKTSWPVTKIIATQTGTTRADGRFPFNIKNAQDLSGWYLVIFSGTDVSGDTIIDKRWIALGIDKSNKPLYPEYMIHPPAPGSAEPGNAVSIMFGTSAAKAFVVRARVPLTDSLSSFSSFSLSNTIDRQLLPVTEADRGGFAVEDAFILDNRIFTNTQIVNVPWTSKMLTIHYSTWKDKTIPGSKETWTVKLAGDKKEKVVAELLTGMYDASLDLFNANSWSKPDIYPSFSIRDIWNGSANFGRNESIGKYSGNDNVTRFQKRYDAFIGSASMVRARYTVARPMMAAAENSGMSGEDAAVSDTEVMRKKRAEPGGDPEPQPAAPQQDSAKLPPPVPDPGVTIRKNFNETAFFLADLHTDAEGNVSFSFTMPEALTKWKWMLFAHTKDLAFGLGEKPVITQKDLMLQPNMPRFLRQGDSLQVPVKISNLSGKGITGSIRLDWRDAADSSERNTVFGNRKPEQSFSVPAGQSRTYFFPATIARDQSEPVYYRLIARSEGPDNLSDGEEGILPVLSNRRLVTETLPVRLNRETSKTYDWDKLLHSDSSKTLRQHSVTVEYSTRPAWYAVQALPYLMEFPYECAEQIFNRYYANALGSQIVLKVPGMAGVMAAWKSNDSAALQSNLAKNEELKTVLLRETPWVVEAQSETAQRQRLAALMDPVNLNLELSKALGKLQKMQSDAGGFPWFAGGRDDRYITQYIMTGVGHLIKLNALPASDKQSYSSIVMKALIYLDNQLRKDYDRRPKKTANDNIDPLQIQYLYMRSFFKDIDIPGNTFFAFNYYRRLAQKQWPAQNMFLRGMIALCLNRSGDKKTAQDIIRSLRENAISNGKDGMYWKRAGSGYYWQESPVETQALLIETFAELGQTAETDDLKWWLLQQKQTSHWTSTRSTADACYALLMTGSDWLGNAQQATITLGGKVVSEKAAKSEAGTGYFKEIIPADKITPVLGHISIAVTSTSGKTIPSFGAVYWQYFEDLDKISSATTSLIIAKTLFVQKNSDKGEIAEALATGAVLHAGDKLLLRFILKTDRDLSYVQLQDQRAACLEPVDAISGYHWQGDLGFYQAPGDESTSFFFDYLPKGTHVVEYSAYVTTNGIFSGGISTLQTMYAPEFAGHSAGSRLQVTEKQP